MKKLWIVILFIGGFCTSEKLCARSILARHEERFLREVNRRPLTIALFYRDYRATRHCDANESEMMMRAERIFERVSTNCRFKDGGLIFIKASVLCDDMKDLAQSYSITRIPACVLFKESELVRDAQGKPAVLMGIRSQESIVQFIKKYLHNELDENREEYLRRREIRALEGPQVSIGVGVGWWGPGWGYYDPFDYDYPWTYYGGWGYGRGACHRGCRSSSGCHHSCRK